MGFAPRSIFFYCVFCSLYWSIGAANQSQPYEMTLDSTFQPGNLLDVLASALGGRKGKFYQVAAQGELPEIEAELLPTLAAFSRNKFGKLNPKAVKYALHRLFVQRHGWHVTGLEVEGASLKKSSPSALPVLDRMPQTVRTIIERRLGEQGFEPRDVAVLAVTIEHLVHEEASERLRAAYELFELSTTESVTQKEALDAIDMYMASYILGKDIQTTPAWRMKKFFTFIGKIYPTWNATQAFVRGVFAAHQAKNSAGNGKLELSSFENVSAVINDLGDRYGRWQNTECQDLKSQLLQLEDRGTGRVRLADFYGGALNGKWQFTESVDYLRTNGALDDSNPSNLKVIIPNYIYGKSNCIGSSHYHAICCIDECEQIFARLERELQKPEAMPEEILALIPDIKSSTTVANRSLPSLFLQRLSRIAEDHAGLVPIHGRLFGQWLHHVFPRECPFPHLAGTIAPKTIYDLLSNRSHSYGVSGMANQTDLERFAKDKSSSGHGSTPVESAPWIHQEEMFLLDESAAAHSVPPAWGALHCLVSVTTLATLGLVLTRTAAVASKRRGARSTAHKVDATAMLATGPFSV